MGPLTRDCPPKPPRGSHWLAGRKRRAARTAAEQKEMQAALRRDERRCRRVRCPYMRHKPVVDPAHMVHRGMGGDPKGTRTTRATVISLCRVHHGLYDTDKLRIFPLTPEDFDGPCDYHEQDPETGEWRHIGTESRVGVSVART